MEHPISPATKKNGPSSAQESPSLPQKSNDLENQKPDNLEEVTRQLLRLKFHGCQNPV